MPVSPGIAIGVFHLETRGGGISPRIWPIRPEDIASELERFEKALVLTEKEIHQLKSRVLAMSGSTEAAIFDAHLLLLRDRMIRRGLEEELHQRMQNVDAVYYAVVQNFVEMMRQLNDPYLRSRVSDMEDIMHRVLKNLGGYELHSSYAEEKPTEPYLLAVHDLSPSDTANLDRRLVKGFATEAGSTASHTAILARSLGLPAVVMVPKLIAELQEKQFGIIDGYHGHIILNPSERTQEYYRNLQAKKEEEYQRFKELNHLPAQTLDGRLLRLAANVEFAHECSDLSDSGAEGIGLYRSEFFLLEQGEMPDEEKQYQHYKNIVETCAPHEVVFRTLDAGGDKLPFEPIREPEDNPFLGWRGIRVSLSRPESFRDQLRAVLRTSAHGKVAIMFPMISGLTEVLEIKEHLEACREELRERGQAFDPNMRVGVMIEVPSAAMMVDVIAKHVDFFSIGSNDLTQYTIAVDRVNYRVADMFRPAHPGVIRLINHTIKVGGIPTAICGETGSDLTLLPLLVGLGAHEISAGAHVLPMIRYAIRHLNYEECQALVERALQAHDSIAIRDMSRELAMRSYPDLLNND